MDKTLSMFAISLFLFFPCFKSLSETNGYQGNLVQISIPKSGTHLLWRVICKLTGRSMQFWKPGKAIRNWKKLSYVSLEDADALSSLGSQYLWITHTVYSDKMHQLLQKNKCKIIFIYRDPRDQLVSSAHFLKKRNPKVLASDSISELITKLILEGPSLPDKNIIPGIANMYYSRMQWKQCPEVFSIRFEDLVSNDSTIQCMILKNLADYLEVSVTDETLQSVVASVFGKGATFRKGSTGEWKTHLTVEQKNLIIQEVGPLLIDLEYEHDLKE